MAVCRTRRGVITSEPDVVKTKLFFRCGRLVGMYLRRCYRARDGKRHAYWALVKSVRTAKGPRQEVVAYLGDLDEAGRLGVQQAATGDDLSARQQEMFDAPQPRYVEVDLSGVVV